MKRMILKNWLAAVLLMGACCGFVACDDDNDGGTPPPADPDVTVVKGNYSGTMSVVEVTPHEGESSGTAVEATVSDDKIKFGEFPIRDLVVRIVGEENADAIVALVGKVEYAVPYSALMSEDKTTVKMTLSPAPLKLAIGEEGNGGSEAAPALEVEVTISTATEGEYTVESGNLAFGLKVEAIAVGGTPLEGFQPFTLDFDLNKPKPTQQANL